MESQNLITRNPDKLKFSGPHFQHQYLRDLSLIHEQFVELWFKHINYFEASSGQLPSENLKFIDGLNFVECCYLQQEMDQMADVVAHYDEREANKPRDFYTVVYDMQAQVSAYMNYLDQRITALHQLHELMENSSRLSDYYFYFGQSVTV